MLRLWVSRNKRRFKEDGFDLDLTYINERIIAMGFPAEKIEGVFRNHIKDVSRFLESKHKDKYKLYNLCSERHYDPSNFAGRVANFPFDDHNPPSIEQIKPFCEDVATWLAKDKSNVVAIHCKAGKGRTGVMICAFLLHSGSSKTAKEALQYYSEQRTRDSRGVTIPSQRRYVEYYELVKPGGLEYTVVTLKPLWISFSPHPYINGGTFIVSLIINVGKKEIFRSPPLEVKKTTKECFMFKFGPNVPLISGDVRIEFKHRNEVLNVRKSPLFSFWFNTFFINPLIPLHNVNGHCVPQDDLNPQASGSGEEQVTLVLTKGELDDAHKDKNDKLFPKEFKVEMGFAKCAEGSHTSNGEPSSVVQSYSYFNNSNGQRSETSDSDTTSATTSSSSSNDSINESDSNT